MIEEVQHGLRMIDPNNLNDVNEVTRMHLSLLSWGPMAQLGRPFLQRYVYTHLVKDGLMKVALYEIAGKTAGFIAFTEYSLTFHRIAMRKHWFLVIFLVCISVIIKPSIVLKILKPFRLVKSRRTEKKLGHDPSAEILAIAVYPEYRTPQFIYKTGLQIAKELYIHAVSYFKGIGLREMRLVVDAFNKNTIFFYYGMGGRLEPYERGGEPMVQIWFDLEGLQK